MRFLHHARKKVDAFLLLALLFQCLPVPCPAQSLCAWLEQSPAWGKAGSGSCVSNNVTSAGLPSVFVALCNQAACEDPPSVLWRGPGSPYSVSALTGLHRGLWCVCGPLGPHSEGFVLLQLKHGS